MKKRLSNRRQFLFAVVIAIILLAFTAATAQNATAQTIEAQVNLPYIIQFGFGSYEAGGLNVYTLRVPLPYTFVLGPGSDAWRLVLTTYLGYGHASFESGALGPRLNLSQDFAFLLPNAELQIPIRRWWTVKPFVALGFGRTFNGHLRFDGVFEGISTQSLDDSSILLYGAGISNLFEARMNDFLISFGTKVGGAWTSAIGEPGSQGFGTFQNGLEARHPVGFTVRGIEPDIGASFVYYHFFPAAEFTQGDRPSLKVSDQFEFGLNIGSAKPLKLWILENPKIGMSYRFGDGLTGLRVNFGFPF